MTVFDWVLVIGVSITILLFISLCVFLFRGIGLSKKIRTIEKSKKKGKKKKKELRGLLSKKKKNSRIIFFSLISMLMFGGSTFYAKWYQSTNLQDVDMDNLVFGYYLLDQMGKQFDSVGSEDSKKIEENIHSLALKISAFSSKSGSDKGTKESQVLLNRYYSRFGQFGVNVASQNYDDIKNNVDEYKDDIKDIKSVQKKALDYYKINEESLKQSK